MTIEPMPGKVLVKRFDPIKVSEGGIHLVHLNSPRHEDGQRGIVLAVGEPVRLASGAVVPPGVSIGDTVVFRYSAGEEFEVDGHTLLLMDESMIRAIELG